jgi:ABC-type nitrate/sulfonate/bicarbonate transport system permease component
VTDRRSSLAPRPSPLMDASPAPATGDGTATGRGTKDEGRRTARTALTSAGLAVGTPLLLLLLWELASRQGWLNPLFFPPPSAVLRTWWRLLTAGGLGADIRVSVIRLLAGFALGAIPGIALGMAMGLWGPVRAAVLPTVTALYPIPRIAILPLVLVVFGIGESGKLFMIAFSVFFLMLLQTMAGVRGIEPVMLDVARSVRASRLRQYWSVALPGALPAIFTGVRLALGFALIVIVGTEFLASREGVGARIWQAYQVLDVETMFAGLITTALIGWALNLAVDLVERLAIPWRAR